MQGEESQCGVTVTVFQGRGAVTVYLEPGDVLGWRVVTALNEAGDAVLLAPDLWARAIALATSGVDETGR